MKTLNLSGVLATIGIILVASTFAFFVIRPGNGPDEKPLPIAWPTLGDWGDFLGAAVAAIAFVWLIVGHFHNQQQIIDGQAQANNQLGLTRELVGALGRIAAINQVQAAAELAEGEPKFTYVGLTNAGQVTGNFSPNAGENAAKFRNEGGGIEILSIAAKTADLTCTTNSLIVLRGQDVSITLKSPNPLPTLGKLDYVLVFRDNFARIGRLVFHADGIHSAHEVETRMGLEDQISASV